MSLAYQTAIRYLFSLQKFGIKLGLSNIQNLLRALGEPHEKVPIIHIAGTNGKGSVAAFIHSVLRRQGYKVGLFTSPHLEDFRERIRINDRCIPAEAVVDYCRRIRAALREKAADFSPPGFVTFFEFVTAMAYSHFADQGVDFALMEVGLGGRLDSTNAAVPIITIITDIDYDHTDRLGTTLKEIAGEKCGIIKRSVPVLTSPQKTEVMEVMEAVAAQHAAPLTLGGRDYFWERASYNLDGQVFNYREESLELKGLRIRLLGMHQALNAALATASCLMLQRNGYRLTEEALRGGLEEAVWPGRLEVMSVSPYVLLDGAHNPSAARVLAEAVKELFPRAAPVLVFGAMGDKDLSGMLDALVPMAGRVVVTRPEMKRAAGIAVLNELVSAYGKETFTAETVSGALELALKGAGRDDVILITGSLFTVGEARAYLRLRDE